MKDLDFDELDKAVNSLMTTPSSTTPSIDEDVATTKDAPLSDDDTTMSTTADQQDQAPTVPVATPTVVTPTSPPLAARRGGRFMDVVHPSSEMKRPVVQSSSVSRQGPTIARTPTVDTRTTSQPQPRRQEPVTGSSEWPDPLELPAQHQADQQPTVSSDGSAIEISSVSYPGEPEPLVTPFLSDAKVDKRPLGSGALALSDVSEEASVAPKTTSPLHQNAQLPALPGDVEPLLPEELRGDMMAVEADTHMGVPRTEDTQPPEPISMASPVLSPEPARQTTATEAPAAQSSIPQQYHEAPSTGDQDNGAIYDVDSYHQPLSHPAKKKSGWLWVVWIVAILLLGAAGGAALYFLGVV
jgi:hypothetical protein